MTNEPNERRALILDMADQLHRAEGLLDDLVREPNIRRRFADSPATVLVERGLLPEARDWSLRDADRVFFAMLANRELLQWMHRYAPWITLSPVEAEIVDRWARGEDHLSTSDSFRIATAETIVANEQFFKELERRFREDPTIGSMIREHPSLREDPRPFPPVIVIVWTMVVVYSYAVVRTHAYVWGVPQSGLPEASFARMLMDYSDNIARQGRGGGS